MGGHAGWHARRQPGGFSLVELLVAMTLGLLLISGMVSVFAGNRRSSDLNSAISNMQESARFALDALAADVRISGFQGCLPVQSGQTDVLAGPTPRPPPTNRFMASATTASVIRANGTWDPAPPNGFVAASHPAVPGTHALALQYGDPDTRRLRAEMRLGGKPSPAGVVQLETALDGARKDDVAIISNCAQADIFRITGVDNGGLNLQHKASGNGGSGNLSVAYGDAATIGETIVTLFRSNVYYVAETGQTNEDGDAVRALFRQSLPYGDTVTNPPTEIVTGIENLRVAFGIRQATGNLRYVSPDSAEYEPERVQSVRIGLLMASRDRIAAEDDVRTYTLAAQQIPPGGDPDSGLTHAGDSRYRLAFNTTIKVRNRRFNE